MNRYLRLPAFVFSWAVLAGAACAEETLYNGIVLPDTWPPRPETFINCEEDAPPYLQAPPAVIPIDVGRQLLMDDFLIQSTTLSREFHLPQWHPATPLLTAKESWEVRNGSPFAAPFSDGVWHDPRDGLFKMWYMGGSNVFFCYATSTDGVHWDRPTFDGLYPDANVLKIEPVERDSSTVWLDLDDPDPKRRFKLLYYRAGLQTRFSADGIHWSDVVAEHRQTGDRTTMFYNPFRKVWVYSIRGGANPFGRCRYYAETRDLGQQAWETWEELSMWVRADESDKVRPGPYAPQRPDLYNLDATPYESLILGLFTIHSQVTDGDRPKVNHVSLGYSRDGFHWSRPDRRAFLNVSEDPQAWNYGNVQSAGGGCLVMGDKLYFYCSGRNSRKKVDDGTGGSTGLAILRRDGFASMSSGDGVGEMTTRPVQFAGRRLFVNVDCPDGELTAEIVSDDGKAIEPFTRKNCRAVRADSTIQAIAWRGAEDLAPVAGKPVRIRFFVKRGKLYSFWVSPEKNGASQGYVAAGGPGFEGHRDTVGIESYSLPKSKAKP